MSQPGTDAVNVAHHGPPILTERDAHICEAMTKWIDTVRKHGKGISYGPNWLPSSIDIIKSRLFWRIRSGKEPLPHPPPCCYSCPWYEVVEEPAPHWTMECWLTADHPQWKYVSDAAIVGQCAYAVERRNDDGSLVVTFGPWRFNVWPGAHPNNGNTPGYFIQRIAA